MPLSSLFVQKPQEVILYRKLGEMLHLPTATFGPSTRTHSPPERLHKHTIYSLTLPLQSDSYGWHFQYLTIIGISISTACFASGLIADITNSHTFFTIKNYLSLVAAPIEILISILYWSLRAIDPKLVVPPDMPMLPLVTDLCFHCT